MKRIFKCLTGVLLAVCMVPAAAFAADITPSTSSIVLKEGESQVVFDINIKSDVDFAGAEVGLKPSAGDVVLNGSVAEYKDTKGYAHVDTEKKGIYYYGFFSSSNNFKAGRTYNIGTFTYKYTGRGTRTISLAESKIVIVNGDKTTTGDTSSQPFTVTITREGGGSSPGGNAGGGQSGGATAPDSKNNAVILTDTQNAEITADYANAAPGQKVTVRLKVMKGFRAGGITVKDAAGNVIRVTDNGDGTYSFIMPEGAVAVTADVKNENSNDNGGSGNYSDQFDNCPAKMYLDVERSLWYHEAVDHVLSNGRMNGTGANLFEPDTKLSRAMMVQILYNMEGRPDASAASAFRDVNAGEWFAKAVSWASSNNIVNGYSEDTFAPDDELTREQMAAILQRYAQYKKYDTSALADIDSYSDRTQVSQWAKNNMKWAVGAGLINGMGGGRLAPQDTATRAQVAQVIMKFDNTIVK